MRRTDGFTLLELLVAIMLFAIVSLMAYSGLAHMVKIKSGNDAASERLSALQLSWLHLRQDLSQAIDRSVRGSYGETVAAVVGGEGAEQAIELTRGGIRSLPGWSRIGLQRIAYGVEEGTLYRYQWAVLDRDVDSESLASPLLTGVKTFELRFLGTDGEWQSAWPPQSNDPDGAGLPRAIEVSLVLDDLERVNRLFELGAPPQRKETGPGV